LPQSHRVPYGADVEVSIVVPTLDVTSDAVRECLRCVKATVQVPHELIVVDNGAPPQGFTAPVNAGLRAARGRHLVVLNDDVEVLDGWWEPLARALNAGADVVFPTTVEGEMIGFPAWCFAMRCDVLERFAVAPGEFLDRSLAIWASDVDLQPIVLHARGPGWHGQTLPWPASIGDFLLAGEVALSASPDEIAVQLVFADEHDSEMFYFSLVPGAVRTRRGYFLLERERAKVVPEHAGGRCDPEWSAISKVVLRCASDRDASATVASLRVFAEPLP